MSTTDILIFIAVMGTILIVLFIGWVFCASLARGNTFVCRKCGVAVRSEEVIWSEGIPYCSHGCEL